MKPRLSPEPADTALQIRRLAAAGVSRATIEKKLDAILSRELAERRKCIRRLTLTVRLLAEARRIAA
jgi:hypothetical protein